MRRLAETCFAALVLSGCFDLDNAERMIPGGGDSLLSVGHALEFAETTDGILHLYPFTCLPETSVRQVLQPYLAKRRVPYMHFNLDEQTGEEGFSTRLETFVDMIRMRHEASE